MMIKVALLLVCIAVVVYGQEKQNMVGGIYPGMGGMQMCGGRYCPMGQICSYQMGYPMCTMYGNGMYPGMGGMNPGMGMYPGMAMTEEENPATAPKTPNEEQTPADITESV